MHGWLSEANEHGLRRILSRRRPEVIVELGSWYGKSATFILEHAPSDAVLYCVDMWDEQFIKDMWANRGKNYADHVGFIDSHPLHHTFLVNLWAHRSRVVPLKMDTREGLRVVHRERGGPGVDLIYIDAGHEYGNVRADLQLSAALFPGAILCGDDWEWDEVSRAIRDHCRQHGRQVTPEGNFWELSSPGIA